MISFNSFLGYSREGVVVGNGDDRELWASRAAPYMTKRPAYG